jgi:lipopolysaccharide biosynthesis protein
MAKQYGIYGFCYYYYWFSGKKILDEPLNDMLADPESDMPFCLCWANENWTRRWDGADHEVLIAQKYLPTDDLDFIKSLVPFFEDSRYIRLDKKPFLIVYCPQHLPDARNTVKIWRNYCRSTGVGEIHLCAALTHSNEDYRPFGFDSGVEFPPHNLRSSNINSNVNFYRNFRGNVIQYASIAQSYLDRTYGVSRVFKTLFPSWDNTARSKENALVVLNGVPDNYEYWLAATIDKGKQSGGHEELIFINAWNEWAEGCHLEPDRWFGHKFLQATLNAISGLRRFSTFPEVSLPHKEEEAHRTFWKEIGSVIGYHAWLRLGGVRLFVNRKLWLRKLTLRLLRVVQNLL